MNQINVAPSGRGVMDSTLGFLRGSLQTSLGWRDSRPRGEGLESSPARPFYHGFCAIMQKMFESLKDAL